MTSHRPRYAAFAATLVVAAAPGFAPAQTLFTNAAAFNGGYGRSAGSENYPVSPTLADASTNLTPASAANQTGTGQALFATVGGAASTFSGVGGGTFNITAASDHLTVVVQGDNNNVTVNSTSTGTGSTTTNNGNP